MIEVAVVSVPDGSNLAYRAAIYDCMRISKFKNVLLIDETSAIAYQYASQWRDSFQRGEKRIIMFASIGNSKTTFSVV